MISKFGKCISLLHRTQQLLGLALILSIFFVGLPSFAMAQDDGGDTKAKKEKTEKVKQEKPPKAKKEKVKKEKPPKAKKEKKPKKSKSADLDTDDDASGGDDGSKRKKKKKKKKKGKDEDEEVAAPKSDGANTANERFHSNNADSTTKHGRAVPCARYSRGRMEYIDKNNVYVAIKRTKRREIHINNNKGIHGKKEPKMKKGKSKDKGNKLVFKIEWQSDCEYKLIFKRSKKKTKFKKGWEMDCRIIACYEDFYDCDCDIHDIMQFASIHKRLTKREMAAREVIRQDSINEAKADSLATVEEIARVKAFEEEERERQNYDEIFGPIKRDGRPTKPDAKPEGDGDNAPDAKKEANPLKDEKDVKAAGDDPPAEKKEKKKKEPKEKKSDDSPEDDSPKEKKVKAPKEKKEKAPKAPKEKKVKAPKEKKEKAPKAPKEKKAKAPKEKKEKAPKAPKEKKEKAPKPTEDGEE